MKKGAFGILQGFVLAILVGVAFFYILSNFIGVAKTSADQGICISAAAGKAKNENFIAQCQPQTLEIKKDGFYLEGHKTKTSGDKLIKDTVFRNVGNSMIECRKKLGNNKLIVVDDGDCVYCGNVKFDADVQEHPKYWKGDASDFVREPLPSLEAKLTSFRAWLADNTVGEGTSIKGVEAKYFEKLLPVINADVITDFPKIIPNFEAYPDEILIRDKDGHGTEYHVFYLQVDDYANKPNDVKALVFLRRDADLPVEFKHSNSRLPFCEKIH